MILTFMYGEDAGLAIFLATIECECCGLKGGEHLSRVPAIMGGTPLTEPLSEDDRFICNQCFEVWYDEGLTIPEEIGRRCNELREENRIKHERDGSG